MTRTPWRATGALALWATVAAGAALAQRPHRTGLWVELGTGPAWARTACSTCDDVISAPGSSGYLRIGGLLSDDVLLGVENFSFIDETFGFAPEDTSIVAETAMIAAVVLWYPWRSGFFLKGGVGAAHGEYTVRTEPQSTTSTGTGIGMTFGVGFDRPISRKLAVTANLGAFITAIGDFDLPAQRVDDVIGSVYNVTIGLTFR